MQTFHSMQMFITVTTYLRGTRILAEQQEDAAAAAAGVAGAGAVGVQLEPRSLALFQQLCTDLFRGMFGLAGMGNAFGTAAGDVAAVEVQNLLPHLMNCYLFFSNSNLCLKHPIVDQDAKTGSGQTKGSLKRKPFFLSARRS